MSASAQLVASGEHDRGLLPEPTAISESSVNHRLDRICTIVAVTAIALLTVRRWAVMGPFPPGLDGAQWLALGRGLANQEAGRSTEGAYAPLVPLLASIADSVVSPLSAVRLLAVGSGLALSLAVWLVARGTLGPLWGLVVTAIVIPASALAEPLFFGGYPQQFALATGIVTLWSVCRFLGESSGISTDPSWPTAAGTARAWPAMYPYHTSGFQTPLHFPRVPGDRRNLVLVAVGALLTAAAHHIYFPVIMLAVLSVSALWLTEHSLKSNPARILAPLLLTLTPALALFAAVAFGFMRAGYGAPIGASTRPVVDAWTYGTREAPELWLLILAFGVFGLLAGGRAAGDHARLLALGLLAPAGLLFLLSGQPRLVPPLLIGAGIAAGRCARWVASTGPRAGAATLLLALAIGVALVVPADRATAQFADFYHVVDGSLVRAAAAIEANSDSGAVAVRKDRRGWPIGWWFEALLDHRIIVGSDPRWLGFPAEREHARQAEELFDGGLDGETFRQRVATSGVRYLVIAKWEWIGWERWLATPGFPVAKIYDDDRYLVLRVT
jgi:hypothetical protein